MSVSATDIRAGWRHHWDWVAKSLVVAALVLVRYLAYAAAGGLWRDEIHSVDMALLPSDDLFFALTNESFPVGWQLLLRGWIAAFGSSDTSVRMLGFLVGLAVIPAMLWMARQFGTTYPWWLLVFLGLDPSLVVYGGEVRAYGLGIITFLILIGASWRCLQRPTAARWCGLIVSALLAVQTSYTNCFMLAATIMACGIVALRHRRWIVCLGFGLIGLVAAVSMIPYALFVFPRLSTSIKSFFGHVDWSVPVVVFLQMYNWGGLARGRVWIAVGVWASLEILRRLLFSPKADACQPTDSPTNSSLNALGDQDLCLFLPPFFWIGTIGFWGYIFMLGVPTQLWYHLPWLTLLAVTTELGMVLWSRRRASLGWLIAGLATLSCLIILCNVVPRVRHRFTTMDLIAVELKETVSPDDLVVVIPWYFGISFSRYYHGPADWIKLPNVDQNGRHCGYAELKEGAMLLPTPIGIRQELERIEAVITSGGKVWLISPFPPLAPGSPPTELTGAPDPKQGWSELAYNNSWQQLAIARMESAGAIMNQWKSPRPGEVNPHENTSVYVFEQSRQRQ